MESKPLQKWEYKLEYKLAYRGTPPTSMFYVEPYLANQGEEGWELCSCTISKDQNDGRGNSEDHYDFIFKRPKV